MTVNTAVVPSLETVGETEATSGAFLTSSLSVVSRGSVAGDSPCFAGLAGDPSDTLTSSGPFAPTPNPSVSRS